MLRTSSLVVYFVMYRWCAALTGRRHWRQQFQTRSRRGCWVRLLSTETSVLESRQNVHRSVLSEYSSSMSTRRHANSPNGQLAETEVIAPTSQITHLLSNLVTTIARNHLSKYRMSWAHVWRIQHGNPRLKVCFYRLSVQVVLSCRQVAFWRDDHEYNNYI